VAVHAGHHDVEQDQVGRAFALRDLSARSPVLAIFVR
jgi:hypothetical protein